MMLKRENHIYQSSLLTELGVIHGYSTRHFGDLRVSRNREKFLDELHVKREDTVVGEQVHGTRIAVVSTRDRGKILDGIDGLVSKYPKVVLGVTFADCVPILAVDNDAIIIGTAHAGWKGTLEGIAKQLIEEMRDAGANIKNIYISIGPHIGMCCYNVMEDRALAFQDRFGDNEKITVRIQGQWHLDIGFVNYRALLDAGVQKDHIDAPPTCTSCQVAVFNSFRKDSKETFGAQLGVISL